MPDPTVNEAALGQDRGRAGTEALREAIRQKLVLANTVAGARAYEPHAMTTEDGLPALIVQIASEDAGEDQQAATTLVQVWPYTARERFTDLDILAEQVKAALDETRLTAAGHEYFCEHRRSGGDTNDEMWGGITRALTFEVGDLTWLLQTTYAPDPVATLRDWTATKWPNVQTDPQKWNPSAESPGIFWRFEGAPRILEHFPRHTRVEARFRGHILATTAAKRLEWTRRVHEALAVARRLRFTNGSPLFIEAAGADSSAHMIRTGQITVVASYAVMVEEPEQPQVEHAYIGGDVAPQEVI